MLPVTISSTSIHMFYKNDCKKLICQCYTVGELASAIATSQLLHMPHNMLVLFHCSLFILLFSLDLRKDITKFINNYNLISLSLFDELLAYMEANILKSNAHLSEILAYRDSHHSN